MTVNGWRVADSDMHIFEPPDLWQRYIAPEWKHAAPVGLTELRRIAELASHHGVEVVPHGWKTGITAAAARHFQAATPNSPYVEMYHAELFHSTLRSELTGPDPTDLLMLPWSTPLAEWPKERLVSLPRGISRHVVRFVRIGGIVYAIKEISQGLADHEYELLRELAKAGIPVGEWRRVLHPPGSQPSLGRRRESERPRNRSVGCKSFRDGGFSRHAVPPRGASTCFAARLLPLPPRRSPFPPASRPARSPTSSSSLRRAITA